MPFVENLEQRRLFAGISVYPGDDLSAIASATRAGDTVYFQPGVYSIASTGNPRRLPADRQYISNGAVFQSAGHGFLEVDGGSSTELAGFTFSNVSLELKQTSGANVHDNTFADEAGNGVDVFSVRNGHVDQNSFLRVSGTGIYGYPSDNNTFDSNRFDYAYEALHFYANFSNTDVSRNVVTHSQWFGIELQGVENSLRVNNNYMSDWIPSTIDNHDAHIALSVAVGQGRGVEVGNNVILQNGPGQADALWAKDAIEIMGGNVNVHDNYAWGWGGGLLVGTDGSLASSHNTWIGDAANGDYPLDGIPSPARGGYTISRPVVDGDRHYSLSDGSAPAWPSNTNETAGSRQAATAASSAALTGRGSAPAAFAGASLSPAAVNLYWIDTSNGAASYVLQRRPHGHGAYKTIASIGPGANVYQDTYKIHAGGIYDYRLIEVLNGVNATPVTTHARVMRAKKR